MLFLGAIPWEISENLDWCVSLLIQWQWPVRQRTGLTKIDGHPCRRFLSCLSPSCGPRWALLFLLRSSRVPLSLTDARPRPITGPCYLLKLSVQAVHFSLTKLGCVNCFSSNIALATAFLDPFYLNVFSTNRISFSKTRFQSCFVFSFVNLDGREGVGLEHGAGVPYVPQRVFT